MLPQLITSKEFIRRLGISQASFFRLRSSGKIGPRSIKLGRSVRWDSAEVDQWIQAKCPSFKRWEVEQSGR